MFTKGVYHKSLYTKKENEYFYMYQIPPKIGCYIVLDCETTGTTEKDHLIELGGVRMENGKVTLKTIHFYIRPRVAIKESATKIHSMNNDFLTHHYKDENIEDKKNMEIFLEWAGDSIIFSHNAPFDMLFINRELRYWKLKEISKERFRCTMRIFRMVMSYIDPLYDQKFTKLKECCNYFGVGANGNKYHGAKFDCHMSALLLVNIYAKIDSNLFLSKKIDYKHKKDYYSHYNDYIVQKNKNKQNNDYNCPYFIPIKPVNFYSIPPYLLNNDEKYINSKKLREKIMKVKMKEVKVKEKRKILIKKILQKKVMVKKMKKI